MKVFNLLRGIKVAKATYLNLPAENALPLAAPNEEQATAIGTKKLAAPKTLSPYVCLLIIKQSFLHFSFSSFLLLKRYAEGCDLKEDLE